MTKKAHPVMNSLFPPKWEALSLERCPYCGHQLKLLTNGKTYHCENKHNNFFISKEKLERIVREREN